MSSSQYGPGDLTAATIANKARQEDQKARREAGERQERAAEQAGRGRRRV